MNTNNYAPLIQATSRLLVRLRTKNLLLPSLVEEFSLVRMTEPIAGFSITHVPIHDLTCFLDEEWVTEDMLNARAELVYFRHAMSFADDDPSFLFRPTIFLSDWQLVR